MSSTSYYVSGNDVSLTRVLSFSGSDQEELYINDDFIDLWGRLLDFLSSDFMISFQEKNFRVRRSILVNGDKVFFLREVLSATKHLSILGLDINTQKKLLFDANRGGMILITGEPGSGKSTTASCVVIERLNYSGGVAYTIEDPPEFNFSSMVTKGFCIQIPIEENRTLGSYVRGALRSYPAGNCQKILFIGEIRDSETALEALRASANGLLVIATMHGRNIVASLERIISLSSSGSSREEASVLLSAGLSLCLHQVLDEKKGVNSSILVTNPTVKGAILQDKIALLSSEIHSQNQHS
jgi:Tfp pilus assembly pilus retraction ATPase PilT